MVDHDMTVECTGTLRVGEGTIFGHHCTMAARDSVTIGIDCLIAEMVSVRDHDHCFDRLDVATRDQGFSVAPVSIGKNVWLASKVSVLKGVTIGDNAIVGANAVVTRDIPANAIVAITLMALLSSHLRFATERYWMTAGRGTKVIVSVVLLGG